MTICEETVLIRMGHEFCAGFGIGIGIVTVQRLIFPIPPFPFPVLVYLICGDVQEGTYR
jgi:hypothetical protein